MADGRKVRTTLDVDPLCEKYYSVSLDPAPSNTKENTPETHYWDYTRGKRGSGRNRRCCTRNYILLANNLFFVNYNIKLMESFKFELYRQEYGKDFSDIRQLTVEEMEKIRMKMFVEFQVNDPLELVLRINSLVVHLDNFDANNEKSFSLKRLFVCLNKEYVTKIHINWFRFDHIDEIDFNNLTTHFYDIWFPAADDIDLFDKTCTWIVSIRHDGKIFVWNR